MQLQINRNKQVIIRQTYGLLDYVGDVGGLIDGLYYLITFLLFPFWKFNYQSHMLTKLFRAGSNRQARKAEVS